MPARLRIVNVFGQRAVPSESVAPKDVYIISVAGEGKTEEQYFDGLKEISVDNTIWIDRLEKADETDTKSHPNYVLELLEEREKYWKEFGVESNELWMVVELSDGYNKNKLNFKKFESGIADAITRAKQLPVDNKILMNNLGTSVCILVEKLIV